jgi:hypothetical protein
MSSRPRSAPPRSVLPSRSRCVRLAALLSAAAIGSGAKSAGAEAPSQTAPLDSPATPASADALASPAAPASADAAVSADAPLGEPLAPSAGRRALAVAGSIFPGAIVHGTGHYILGRPRTGTLLLVSEGIGVLALVGSFTVLALTGANRDLVGPTIGVAIAGGGLFGISWFADIYGSAVPENARGASPAKAPFLVAELGYRYIHDVAFRYRSFAALGLDARYDRFRLVPSAWRALDDDNGRYRLLAGYRFIGPTPSRMAESGSFVDVELAATHHAYDSDGFDVTTGEGFASSRLDLADVDPVLRGSFAEFGLGWALQSINYGSARDENPVLLGRFAFGAYVGDPAGTGGEVRGYYDHRHDDFVAGLKVAGLGSGAIGHFGLDGRWFFDDRWGISLEAQAGSAVLFGGSLVMRQGRQP